METEETEEWEEAVEVEEETEEDATLTQMTGRAAETVHIAADPAPDPALGPDPGIKAKSLRLLQRISNFYPFSQDNKTCIPPSLCVCVVRV